MHILYFHGFPWLQFKSLSLSLSETFVKCFFFHFYLLISCNECENPFINEHLIFNYFVRLSEYLKAKSVLHFRWIFSSLFSSFYHIFSFNFLVFLKSHWDKTRIITKYVIFLYKNHKVWVITEKSELKCLTFFTH